MTTTATVMTASTGTSLESGQYLTFSLGSEAYGVDILRVQEIKGYTAVTPIPNAPAYLKGVMNLRGTVIPVVDLRLRFGMEPADYTTFTVIIVVTIGARVMGLVVDAVSDVLDIAAGDVEPPPDFGGQVDARCLSGLAKAGDRLVVLLDIERVVGDSALAAGHAGE